MIRSACRILRNRPGRIHRTDPMRPARTRCGIALGRTRDTQLEDQGHALCRICYRLPTRLRVRT